MTSDERALVAFERSRRPVRPGYKKQGLAKRDHMRVVVKLAPKNPLPDPAILGAIPPGERPPTADRETFARCYGARLEDVEKVKEFAKARGLDVAAHQPSRMAVLSADSDAIGKAFGVTLEEFASDAGETYISHAEPLMVPHDLRQRITLISGLDTRRVVKSISPAVLEPQARHRHVGAGKWLGHLPQELAGVYGFPAALDGSKQCIALLEFGGGYKATDVAAYFAAAGFKKAPTVVAVPVGSGSNNPGGADDIEVALDIDVAGAAAPGAKIAVYFSTFDEPGWIEAITSVIHDTVNTPSVVSISWGAPEFSAEWTQAAMAEVDNVFKEAAAKGITVIVASGDDGSEAQIADGRPHVNYPASSPYVLCVGGTTLDVADGARQTEVVWNSGDQLRRTGGAGGGGISDCFPKPPWQDGVAGVVASPVTGFVGRGLPDVAADADPATGYNVLYNGTKDTVGGTSAAAPLWAALIACINEELAGHGGRTVGYFNPLLYSTLGPSAAFHDITEGNNDASGGLGVYGAGTGWDACTGWGVPVGTELMKGLIGS